MGLPCLLEYYYATQLRPLTCWCNPIDSARWRELEVAMTDKIPLQAIISDETLVKYLLDRENPFIFFLLKIWKVTQKLCNIQRKSKLLRWSTFDSDFLPNVGDKRFSV